MRLQIPNVGPAQGLRMLSVCAGGSHTLAICESGELWACGRGRHGQLGFGNFDDVTTLRPIAGLRWASLQCDSATFQCARLLAGKVRSCWNVVILAGGAADGQSLKELGPAASWHIPWEHTPGWQERHTSSWSSCNRCCRSMRIVAAAAGEKHSLALATHGAVYAWGCGKHGQLGVPEIGAFQAANPGVQPAMHTPQFVRALDPTSLQPWNR